MPVSSQESRKGKRGMKKQTVREKKYVAFMNNPWQGRMVQFYKPPTINSKHAHPKLGWDGGQELVRDQGRQRMVTWNSLLAYEHFSPS